MIVLAAAILAYTLGRIHGRRSYERDWSRQTKPRLDVNHVNKNRQEFQVHKLNDTGIAKATQLGEAFSTCLEQIEALIPTGRERALVVTKLQEASFFAKRAIAVLPENQSHD